MDLLLLVSFMTALITLVTTALGLFIAFRNIKKMANQTQATQNLAIQVDGRLTELLELTRRSSYAEGIKDEKANQSTLTKDGQ